MKQHRQGRTVWTNYHTDFSDRIAPAEVLLHDDPKDVCLGLDEGWVVLDSRMSMSGTNESATEVLLKSRKNDVDVNITAQMGRMVEVRFRGIADYTVLMEKARGEGLEAKFVAHVGYWDMASPRLRGIHKVRFALSELVDDEGNVVYNTREVIEGDKWLWLTEMAKVLYRDSEFVRRWRLKKTATEKKELIRFKLGRSGSSMGELLEEFGLYVMKKMDNGG